MRIPEPIKQPTSREQFILRFLIIAGLAAMGFLLYHLFSASVVENAILYSLLMIALSFTCLKFLHEWYHYFYITVPPKPGLTRHYTVDIFTTYCPGEPYEMMLETLTAIQAIKYPHNTYLCDEADDPYLKDLCRKLGIHHVTRTHKINAKAGNINNALRHSTGEICVILDPDHVPFPNFLDSILPQFNDPEVGFVQVVQAYKNFHESLVAKGAAQQTFQFYGPMMMTMNKYGTVLAIGANCTFRRTALDSIGGHAPGLAEDMHTAMQLHAKGWKSVYVPEVLARGLVPSTISAYYSQQLKWSRGVFELLVTSYIKLFNQFTWRQKLHYGIIPFYYLSGIIFLINFLIPVLSLILEVNPIKMDFHTFALIGLPFIVQIILIRNYVQRWVMEDEERGFHIAGGLLAIGTWWIFIMGLIYTIIRKKVPYVPTPKDANEENNWPLNIPNLVILFISLFAIGFGLYNDWNPYTFVMAGLAGLNCLILLYNITASRQITFRRFKKSYNLVNVTAKRAFEVRQVLWKMRIRIYAGVRNISLVLCILTIASTFYVNYQRRSNLSAPVTRLEKKDIFLTGIYAPASSDGLTSMKLVNSFNTKFDIISLYIAWGDKQHGNLPKPLIDSIYNNGSYPMITWEPWQNLFSADSIKPSGTEDKKIFKRISDGDYDFYLRHFSQQVRKLNRPVFIRFAHEPDNPHYPWSSRGLNSAEEFKRAWIYVHTFFAKEGASNAIWIWNPWKPSAVVDYFPGKQYVDWIGITNLNYGKEGPDKKWYSLEQLYTPFHKQRFLTSGIPVMLAETGTLHSEGKQDEWLRDGLIAIKQKFPEIKALVVFNSRYDKIISQNSGSTVLDWHLNNPAVVLASDIRVAENSVVKTLPIDVSSSLASETNQAADSRTMISEIKGVNYSKGLNWLTNYHTLRQKEISADLKEIKRLGFNTIKRYGPGVFDRNILQTAQRNQLKIIYGFYIPDELDFENGHEQMNQLEKDILTTVEKHKGVKAISAWNIGNTPLQKFTHNFYKPQLVYNQYGYLAWLKKVISKIKLADPSRPISVDLEVDKSFTESIMLLQNHVPGIDSYGLVITDNSPKDADFTKLNVPYFLSKVHANNYLKRHKYSEGFFISDWQDQERSTLVTFDGLKDNWGRSKVTLYKMAQNLKSNSQASRLPKVKILKPASTLYPHNRYTYHALVEVNRQWKIAKSLKGELTYKWYLVKTDRYGQAISMDFIKSGPSVSITIPDNYKYYRLYLNASQANDASTAISKLNIPLIQ
ncbi:glycosyltransferase [Flavihumibacter sp. R14]|nr:glycosyltransferase [Flavihumibacter soli]